MNEELKLLADVVSGRDAVYQWEDVLAELEVVLAQPLTPKAEKLMLGLLRFEGELRLTESSELPHSMSPEDMLKSFAVQWLSKKTGLTHLPEMQRVEATAQSPVLASIVRSAIKKAPQIQPRPAGLEVVADVRVRSKPKTAIRSLSKFVYRKPMRPLPRGTPKPERSKETRLAFSTMYEAAWAYPMGISAHTMIAQGQGMTYVSGRKLKARPVKPELALT